MPQEPLSTLDSCCAAVSDQFLMNRDFLVTGGARGIGREICK